MPAPLGNTPTKKMPAIVVFGIEGSQATRGAIRFFRERRIVARFVDLRKQLLTVPEVREWLAAIGVQALLADGIATSGAGEAEAREAGAPQNAAAPQNAGAAPPHAAAAPNAGELAARFRADPALLRLPLVRYGDRMTAGSAEATWKAWLDGLPRR